MGALAGYMVRVGAMGRARSVGVVRGCGLAVAVCALAAGPVHAQPGTGTITLRPVARVAPGRPITLADVARLEGGPADALASVIVLPDGAADGWEALGVEAIRGAIDGQADPIWGHLALLGTECRIRALAPAPAVVAVDGEPEAAAVATEPNSVRAVIERRLAAAFECEIGDLRLEFAERDSELLAVSALGRTVDVQPTGFSERLPLRVTVYEGERIVRAESIRVAVLIRRTVVIVPGGLSRGDLIDPTDLVTDIRWLAPDLVPIAPEAAPGMVMHNRIMPGAALCARDVEAPLVIRRGEALRVHSVGGAVSLQIPARALENGREGDVIRCVTIMGPTTRGPRERGREFLARLAGPGIAVAVDESAESEVSAESADSPELRGITIGPR